MWYKLQADWLNKLFINDKIIAGQEDSANSKVSDKQNKQVQKGTAQVINRIHNP